VAYRWEVRHCVSIVLAVGCSSAPVLDGGVARRCWARPPEATFIPGPISTASVVWDGGGERCLDEGTTYRLVNARTSAVVEVSVDGEGRLVAGPGPGGIYELEGSTDGGWISVRSLSLLEMLEPRWLPQTCTDFEPFPTAYACDGRLYLTDGGRHPTPGDFWLNGGQRVFVSRGGDVFGASSLEGSWTRVLAGVGDVKWWASDGVGITLLSRTRVVRRLGRDGGDVVATQLDAGVIIHRVDGRSFLSRPTATSAETCDLDLDGGCDAVFPSWVDAPRAWEYPGLFDESFTLFEIEFDGGWSHTGASFSVPRGWSGVPNFGRVLFHAPVLRWGSHQVTAWLGSARDDRLVSFVAPFEIAAAGYRWNVLWASGSDGGTMIGEVHP